MRAGRVPILGADTKGPQLYGHLSVVSQFEFGEEARMIFSNLARLLAIAALVLGLGSALLGFAIATEFLGPYEAALARYAGGASSSGPLINRGIYAILF